MLKTVPQNSYFRLFPVREIFKRFHCLNTYVLDQNLHLIFSYFELLQVQFVKSRNVGFCVEFRNTTYSSIKYQLNSFRTIRKKCQGIVRKLEMDLRLGCIIQVHTLIDAINKVASTINRVTQVSFLFILLLLFRLSFIWFFHLFHM